LKTVIIALASAMITVFVRAHFKDGKKALGWRQST
jgi:hypothetical protein